MGALDCISPNGAGSLTDSTEVFANNLSNTSLNTQTRDVEASPFREGSSRHSKWWKLLIDLPLLLAIMIIIPLYEFGGIPSHKAGFYCNDPKLSFPFTGDTVSFGAIIAGTFFSPFVICLIVESLLAKQDTWRKRGLKGLYISAPIYRAYIYGLALNLCIVEVMKGFTGSPRPTFFDICEPDTAKTCIGSQFVSTFECTSTKFGKWMQSDSYHSFPSGHSSLSVYCGFFISWYLQRRAFSWRSRTIFLVPVVQLLALTFAAISSLTRITDHRHHWWDVLVGTAIGFISLFYVVYGLCDNFTYLRRKKHETKPLTPIT